MALQDELMAKTARAAEVGASVVTLAVAIAVLMTVVSRYAWSDGPDAGRPGEEAVAVGVEVSLGPHVKGSAEAKVAILEFSDFECQFCRVYARDQYLVVAKELVDTGQANYAFRHFPLDVIHPRAFMASQAAQCAGEQGRFWEMHDALFSQTLSDAQIRQHAVKVGLESPAFDACMAADSRTLILEDLADGQRVGVVGTPTFLIGVKRPGGKMRITSVLHGRQGISAITAAVEAAAAVS